MRVCVCVTRIHGLEDGDGRAVSPFVWQLPADLLGGPGAQPGVRVPGQPVSDPRVWLCLVRLLRGPLLSLRISLTVFLPL